MIAVRAVSNSLTSRLYTLLSHFLSLDEGVRFVAIRLDAGTASMQ